MYVRMEGPEYVTDEELRERTTIRLEESEPTVRECEQSISRWQLRASELERKRYAARESAATANRPYHVLERAYQKEVAEHKETKETVTAVRVTAIVLLVLLITWILLWWFVLRSGQWRESITANLPRWLSWNQSINGSRAVR